MLGDLEKRVKPFTDRDSCTWLRLHLFQRFDDQGHAQQTRTTGSSIGEESGFGSLARARVDRTEWFGTFASFLDAKWRYFLITPTPRK